MIFHRQILKLQMYKKKEIVCKQSLFLTIFTSIIWLSESLG